MGARSQFSGRVTSPLLEKDGLASARKKCQVVKKGEQVLDAKGKAKKQDDKGGYAP